MSTFREQFLRNRAAVVSAVVSLVICTAALLGPVIAPHATDVRGLADRIHESLQGPSWRHPLGTDLHGNDILSLVLVGARTSLLIGIGASATVLVIGVFIGLTTGYIGGWYDAIWMRLIDVILAFPSLLLLILIAAALEPGVGTLFVALTIVGWAGVSRVVRSVTLAIKNEEFVIAARALGATRTRILSRHVLPNCIPILIVIFTMRVGVTILAVANLNFLGLGDPASISWGGLVFEGHDYIALAPWWSLFPASAIAVTVLAFNFLGDGLRDALDPKMRDLM